MKDSAMNAMLSISRLACRGDLNKNTLACRHAIVKSSRTGNGIINRWTYKYHLNIPLEDAWYSRNTFCNKTILYHVLYNRVGRSSSVLKRYNVRTASMGYWTLTVIVLLIWEKGKVIRKHSLHEENSSLGFIETVHQWKLCLNKFSW